MPSPAMATILRGGYEAQHGLLVRDFASIVGKANIKAGFLPHPNDHLTSIDPWTGKVWTAEATMQGRFVKQRGLWLLNFNGTSNYLTTPDTADTTFGNGTVDTAGGFGAFAVMNHASAGTRSIITKYTTTLGREWIFQTRVGGSGFVALIVGDESVPTTPLRAADVGVPVATLLDAAGIYTAATGGATAASDMTIFQNGLVVASTATNSGTYVAMENGTSEVCIGSVEGHTAQFMNGQLGIVFVWASPTVAQVAALHARMARELQVAA